MFVMYLNNSIEFSLKNVFFIETKWNAESLFCLFYRKPGRDIYVNGRIKY